MVTVQLCVEGGGDSRALKTACRKGFGEFVERAGLAGRMPKIVACGGRDSTLDFFRKALGSGDNVILLVDAEGPVTAQRTWQHLRDRDGWDRPEGALDAQCHLMVQVMESWFLADADALQTYYGQGFRRQSLPQNLNIEAVPKDDVESRLNQATLETAKKGYKKGRDSFPILGGLDPSKVRSASAHADRFIRSLMEMADGN